ncbi:DUF3551 domain-containing protein [Bradyrhizobium sp. USDA 4461]
MRVVCRSGIWARGYVTVIPASAPDFPWCVQGSGYPGDCMYQTRTQCLASASGRCVTRAQPTRGIWRAAESDTPPLSAIVPAAVRWCAAVATMKPSGPSHVNLKFAT